MMQPLLACTAVITSAASADPAARHAQVPDPLITSYFGAVSVAEAPRAAGAAACAALDLGAPPLVLLARDWTGLWHFLTVQLLAAHGALRALGLDPRKPFRLLFADRPGTPPVICSWCTHVQSGASVEMPTCYVFSFFPFSWPQACRALPVWGAAC